jgi:aminopeptidase N
MRRVLGLGAVVFLGIAAVGQAAIWKYQNPGPPWETLLSGKPVPEPKGYMHGHSSFSLAPIDSTHSYDVRFYQLDLQVPMTGPSYQGTVLILNTANQAGLDSIDLDCVELVVDSIKVDGVAAAIDTSDGKIHLGLGRPYAQGEGFEVLIGYHGVADTVYNWYWFPEGMAWFRRGNGGAPETTAYSMAEPSAARQWFPCFDEPWDKADSCKINVTVPKRFQVASNGLLISVDTLGNWTTHRWSETHPITTYLMSVAISKYAILRDEYVTGEGDTIPITHFVYHSDSTSSENGYSEVPDMIAFYSDTFCEYPVSKYGMAAAWPFGGGMEHQTITTILPYSIYPSYELIAHELVHMWWGDMITCVDWRNVWTNEGFATYAEALWTEHRYGVDQFREEMAANQESYFYQAAIRDFPMYDPPEEELFNGGIEYSKGACVLHMLRYILGEEDFWRIWPVYADSFKYGNVNTEEFQRICEQVSGEDLAWFFQEWVYDLGYPVYGYAWQAEDLGLNQFRLTVQVQQFQTAGPIFRMPLEFRFMGLFVDTTVSAIDSLEFQEFQFLINLATAPDSMQFDPHDWVTEVHDTIPFVGVSSGGSQQPLLPTRIELAQSSPNPTSGTARIRFALPREVLVRLGIYNLLGQTVRILVNEQGPAGYHAVTWDGRDERGRRVSPGVYLYRLEGADFGVVRRLSLLQ